AQVALHAHETEAHRTGAQAVEMIDQTFPVVGADGAHVDRPAVAQDLFDCILAEIAGHTFPAGRKRVAIAHSRSREGSSQPWERFRAASAGLPGRAERPSRGWLDARVELDMGVAAWTP